VARCLPGARSLVSAPTPPGCYTPTRATPTRRWGASSPPTPSSTATPSPTATRTATPTATATPSPTPVAVAPPTLSATYAYDRLGNGRGERRAASSSGDHLGSVHGSRRSVPSAQFPVLGSQFLVLSSWFSVLGFTGQRRDATGLLEYRARYDDPALGWFISPESIVPEPGNPQSLNRYAYVHNNPAEVHQPDGALDRKRG
jgi:RHS repeat-associated protein